MSERACALESKAYLALREIYEDRAKAVRAWKASGKKTVWTMGCDVPDEVIIAAGMLPVRTFGQFGEQPMCDKYLELSFGPVWRGQFERIVDGQMTELMDYIAISRSSDMLIRLYYYFREMKRFEPDRPIPPMTFIDYELILRNSRSQAWNEESVQLFIKQIESWSGTKITEEKLRAAAEVCNENRRALADFAALRYGEECRVTGSEALVAIGATLFMEKSESTALIRQLTEDARQWPVVEGTRIFYIGSCQENTEVYDCIQALGGNVVSEDHDWGDRHFERLTQLEQRQDIALADRYAFRSPSGEQSLVSDHCDSIIQKVKATGAQAVVIYMNFNDESYLLEYPDLRDALAEVGIPVLCVTKQQVPMADKEAFGHNFAELLNKVERGSQNG